MKYKCVIDHDPRSTTTEELHNLFTYVKYFELPVEEVLVIDISNFDSEKIKEELVQKGNSVFQLASNEVPLTELLFFLRNYMLNPNSFNPVNIAVPTIHMKYKDAAATIETDSGNKEIKYKKFIDCSNIFLNTTEDIDIKLHDHYNWSVPHIPLSSKWHEWPKAKIILRVPNSESVETFHNMLFSVYKFERII